MSLREAYNFMNEKHMFAFENNKDNVKLNKSIEKLSNRNRKYHVSKIIKDLEKDISKFGEEEIVWIYFKEEKGILIPYRYIMPRHESFYSSEPSVETLLKHALEVFKLTEK